MAIVPMLAWLWLVSLAVAVRASDSSPGVQYVGGGPAPSPQVLPVAELIESRELPYLSSALPDVEHDQEVPTVPVPLTHNTAPEAVLRHPSLPVAVDLARGPTRARPLQEDRPDGFLDSLARSMISVTGLSLEDRSYELTRILHECDSYLSELRLQEILRAYPELLEEALLNRQTPLSYASRGCPALVEILVQEGALLDHERHNRFPVQVAAQHCPECLEILLRHGADPNRFVVDHTQYVSATGLIAASRGCQVDSVTALVRAGARLNSALHCGELAEAFDTLQGRPRPQMCIDTLHTLVRLGARVDRVCTRGWDSTTPISRAVEHCMLPTLTEFLRHPVDPATLSIGKPSISALRCPIGTAMDMLAQLVGAGLDINTVYTNSHDSFTTLILAAQMRNVILVSELLRLGASQQVPGVSTSPLTAAAFGYMSPVNENGVETVLVLLQAGADVAFECQDSHADMETALIAAATSSSIEVMSLLLRHGAEPSQVSESGNTALEAAVRSRCIECINMLVQAGATVPGDLLFTAVDVGSGPVIQCLIRHGIPRTARSDGINAVQYASLQARDDLADLLSTIPR